MTRNEAIAELVRIWHSPHLDLMLKARLGEVIDALKEKNRSDSLVRGEVDACKESESKLDLISRADAIEAIEEITWYHQNRNGEMVSGANSTEDQAWYKSQDIYTALEALPSAEARPTGEWIFNTSTSSGKSWNVCSECGESIFHPANFCPNCGARMKGCDSE